MGLASFYTGFMDDDGFGLVFFRGERCVGESCEDSWYHYFETRAGCEPWPLGHHRRVRRPGGRAGTCWDIEGELRWGLPGALDERERCDTDWSARNISGTYDVITADAHDLSTGLLPARITFAQGKDLARATLTVSGSSSPFLNDTPFAGDVERRRFSAKIDEPLTSPCRGRRRATISFDFESFAFTFGIIDLDVDVTDSTCSVPGASASMHFMLQK
jgi:hypothetical protein